MKAYWISAILVVLGGVSLLSGVVMGVKPSANYLVEAGFGAFALAAALFVGSVLLGLWREFQETA